MLNHKEIKKWDVAKLLVTKMDYKLLLYYLPQYGIYVESLSPIPFSHSKTPHGLGYHFDLGDQKQPHIVTVRTQHQDNISDFIQDHPELRAYRIFKHGLNFRRLEKKYLIGLICETVKNMLHLYRGKTFRIASKNRDLSNLFYEKAVEVNEEDNLGCSFDYDEYDYTLEIRAYKRFKFSTAKNRFKFRRRKRDGAKERVFHRWGVVTILYGPTLINRWSQIDAYDDLIVEDA